MPEDFVEKAKKMIEELEDYKRDSHEKENRPVYYGDLDEKYIKNVKRALEHGGRLNLNDAGDIYFELSDSVEYLVDEVIENGRKSEEAYKMNQSYKSIRENIDMHHRRSVVSDIIKRHFVVI